jgi:hypothetical protein
MSKGKLEQIFDAAFGTTFRISKCFQRSKQKLHTDFSLKLRTKQAKNLKPFAHFEFYRPLKKYSTGDIIP